MGKLIEFLKFSLIFIILNPQIEELISWVLRDEKTNPDVTFFFKVQATLQWIRFHSWKCANSKRGMNYSRFNLFCGQFSNLRFVHLQYNQSSRSPAYNMNKCIDIHNI